MTETDRPNLALLRAMVAGDARALRNALEEPDADIVGFLRFAHCHQLGAYVAWSLRELGVVDALSPALAAAARATSLAERRRCARQVEEMRALAGILAEGGIDVVFLKGPLFARRFYGSVRARAFADLDVLVRRPDDLPCVEALLLEAGYEPAFRVLGSRRLTRYFAHHLEYRRDGLPLDVHWTLQRHFTFALDHERIWATRERVALGERDYPTTSAEYALVAHVLGVLTDLQVGKLVLRPLVDLYHVLAAVEETMDWNAFFAARRRERILKPCLYVLALVLEVLDRSDRFAALATVLEPQLGALPPVGPARCAVFESRKLDPAQKLLALRLYETPLVAALSWWLVSLPFRFAAYDDTPRA